MASDDLLDDRGITVTVISQYLEEESDPMNGRFVFAYTIDIINDGTEAAQLLNRHWLITDAEEEVQEVRGAGVVGEQPRLRPGQSFNYTSAAIIATPLGVMQGSYEFQTDDGARFDVAIPVFTLSLPNIVH